MPAFSPPPPDQAAGPAENALGVPMSVLVDHASFALRHDDLSVLAPLCRSVCHHASLLPLPTRQLDPAMDQALQECTHRARLGDFSSLISWVSKQSADLLNAHLFSHGTAWHQFAASPGLADAFLEQGANPRLRNRLGATVLDRAFELETPSTAAVLLAEGLTPTLPLEVHALSCLAQIKQLAQEFVRPRLNDAKRPARRAEICATRDKSLAWLHALVGFGADVARVVFDPSCATTTSVREAVEGPVFEHVLLTDWKAQIMEAIHQPPSPRRSSWKT